MDHIYNGLCPDPTQPGSRDPDCPACDAIDRLIQFALSFARCPCCGETVQCEDECTFAAIDMDAAREALAGVDGSGVV